MRGDIATVEEGPPCTMKVCSVAPPSIRLTPPTDFLDVLRGWGQTWKWDDLRVTGSTDWIAHAIADNSLVAVTDGSYIKEHWPELCSAAFVLECTKGQGQLTGAFAEASVAANPYRGELLGLMAIHLLLLVVKTVSPSLSGSAAIYSDCIGALGRVAKLPPYRIPSRCRYLDILKTIMVNFANLFLPSVVPSCGGTPGQSHLVGGSVPSHPTQFGMWRQGKGNATLSGYKSSPAGGISA